MLLAVLAASASPECEPCHAQRVRAFEVTPHANALSPFRGDRFNARKLRERNSAIFSYDGAQVRVERGSESIDAVIAWAFGSGVQAVTPLIQREGRWVEHRLSWYRTGDRLGLTPGHPLQAGADLEDSLGVVQTAASADRCFGCHATSERPGVQCQACHGAGEAHRAKPAKTNIRRDRGVALCAQCHRSPDRTYLSKTPELDDPTSIRFAPVGLQASQCFQQSASLTCVTCHDPHGAKLDADAACRNCHPSAHARSARARASSCSGCHMPTSSPMPGLRFADHRIRIHPENKRAGRGARSSKQQPASLDQK